MRNYILLFLFLIAMNLFSDSNAPETALKHEIKLDVAYILLPAIKAEYEYLFNNVNTFGVTALIDAFDHIETTYQILAFTRWYFGNSLANEFYFEGHASITGIEDSNYTQISTRRDYFGLGIALGWKFVAKNDIVLDVYVGVGRYTTYLYEFYNRSGISFGKRF